MNLIPVITFPLESVTTTVCTVGVTVWVTGLPLASDQSLFIFKDKFDKE